MGTTAQFPILGRLHDWLESIRGNFERQSKNGYDIFPPLPEGTLAPSDWFAQATDQEKKLMFDMLLKELVTVLQHWTWERDMLYGRGQWKF